MNIRKADWERIERIQSKILRGLFGLTKNTPYWGMLYELDILPVKLQVIYKRMMVYHEIINSDKERVARKILLEQEKYGHKESFVGNMKDEGEEIGLNVRKEEVLNKAKSVWKGEVKVKIKEAFCVLAEEEKQKKKMRSLNVKA